MKIVFLGNMNNLTYYSAKELKKRGFDVTFIVDAEKKNLLDRPESWDKTLDNSYPEWIKEIVLNDSFKGVNFALPLLFLRKYINLINKFDIVFLNGYWISLARYIMPGKKVIAIFAGYDLDVLADYKSVDILTMLFLKNISSKAKIIPQFIPKWLFRKMIYNQRKGIRRAEIVNYYSTGINPAADKLLNEIKFKQTFDRFEFRGFDCDKFPYLKPTDENKKFIILNITRFFYLNARNDNKRNDIMIEGISLFLKKNNPAITDVEILFFEKGEDLADAKKLCDQFGLTPFIRWQEQTSAAALSDYFSYCHVAFDQLGNHWVGAGLLSMLTGRPLIANGRPEIFENLFNEKSPICQSYNARDVEVWLTKLYTERDLIKKIGIDSREYVLKYFSIDATANYFVEKLNLK